MHRYPFSISRYKMLLPLLAQRLHTILTELLAEAEGWPVQEWTAEYFEHLAYTGEMLVGQARVIRKPTLLNMATHLAGLLFQCASAKSAPSPTWSKDTTAALLHLKTELEASLPLGVGIPSPSVLLIAPNSPWQHTLLQQLPCHGIDCHVVPTIEVGAGWLNNLPHSTAAPCIILMSVEDETDYSALVSAPLAHIPKIAMGWGLPFAERLNLLRNGFTGYLHLPIDINDFIFQIDKWLYPEATGFLRILILADTEETFGPYVNELQSKGAIVELLHDPTTIYAKLISARPNLLLVGSKLPGMSGQEIAHLIRQDPQYAFLPLIHYGKGIPEENVFLEVGTIWDDWIALPMSPIEMMHRFAVWIQKTQMLERQISRDPMTGLYTLTATLEMLEIEIARAVRYGTQLCFAILDIDGLATANTQYGYPFGDQIIAECGALLKGRFRKTDTLGRIDDDRFAIILPQVSPPMIHTVLNEIRLRFNALEFPRKGVTHSFTLSGGFVTLDLKNCTAELLYQGALAALAQAKQTGPNRILSFIEVRN